MRKIYVMKSESSHPQWTGGEEVEKEMEKIHFARRRRRREKRREGG